LGEFAHRVAQRVDVFAEVEVQTGQAHGDVSSTASTRAARDARWAIRSLTFT
jgi:hypothetical protein